MSEGLGTMLDPRFRLFEFAEPYLRKEYKRIYSPQNIARELEKNIVQLLHLGRGLPQRASHLLRRVELGDIQVSVRHEGLVQSTGRISKAVDRLSVSILLTLFPFAIGIYILAGHFMGFDFYMVTILLGMIIATAAAAVKILYGMWRQRR